MNAHACMWQESYVESVWLFPLLLFRQSTNGSTEWAQGETKDGTVFTLNFWPVQKNKSLFLSIGTYVYFLAPYISKGNIIFPIYLLTSWFHLTIAWETVPLKTQALRWHTKRCKQTGYVTNYGSTFLFSSSSGNVVISFLIDPTSLNRNSLFNF